MKQLLSYILPLLVCGLMSCDDGDITVNTTQSLVVEGWIENGEFPVVIITKTLPVTTDYQNMNDLSDYLVRWAKVTVSNGEQSVVLTGLYDESYYPPYIYTTSYLRGELGKTYTLKVEYEDQTLTSETTIPTSIPIVDHYQIVPCEGSNNLYKILASFYDNPNEKNYYAFFTKAGLESNHYLASYLGTVDDEMIASKVEYPVYRGNRFDDDEYTPYFKTGEMVSVKLTQVDQSSFSFWDQYTKDQSLTSNMFLSTTTPLPSNIQGGVGYWTGFASVASFLEIR